MYREHAYLCQGVKGQDKIFKQNWLESSVKGVTLLRWDANSLRVTSLLSQSFIDNFVLLVFTPGWRGFVGGELVAKDCGTGNPARPITVILRALLTLPFGCRLSSLVFVVLKAIFLVYFQCILQILGNRIMMQWSSWSISWHRFVLPKKICNKNTVGFR